jgi:DnaJ-class molecular chaperone
MEYFNDLWINCGTCHHKAGAEALGPQACSTCHHAKNGDIADETLSAKVVIHKNCWSCHEVGTGANASAACKTCHTARS